MLLLWVDKTPPHHTSKRCMNDTFLTQKEPSLHSEHMEDAYKTYRKDLSAMGHEAIQQKKAQGELMHLAPFGYRNVKDEQGQSTMEPDPKTHPILLRARNLRSQQLSFRQIAKELNGMGYRSRNSKRFSGTSVYRLLGNSALTELSS